MQWNFSVARELSSTLAITVGYVGSRGVHQPYKMDNMDMVLPRSTPAGYVLPCGSDGMGNPCATGFLPSGTRRVHNRRPLNPNFGRISGSLWQANSSMTHCRSNLDKAREPWFRVSRRLHLGKEYRRLYPPPQPMTHSRMGSLTSSFSTSGLPAGFRISTSLKLLS